MKPALKYLPSLLILLLAGCGVHQIPRPETQKRVPDIRVGIVWGISEIGFKANSRFNIVSHDGTYITSGEAKEKWQAHIVQSSPGKAAYRLMLTDTWDRSAAREQADRMDRTGYLTEVVPNGRPVYLNVKGFNQQRSYRIYLKKQFQTWDDARNYQTEFLQGEATRIVKAKSEESSGLIRLTNTESGQTLESTRPIRLQGADITLFDIPVGVGFHWESRQTRDYPSDIEFTVDLNGMLAVINALPIEEYLKGVIPSEMGSMFPMEALKAQAVAARGKAVANWGIMHNADPFDVCADVHCQVYSGLSRRDPATDKAVDKTYGQIMIKDNEICDAIFGAVCGGHSEDVEKAWGGETVSYLRGIMDGSPWLKRYGSLQNEQNLKQWIDDSPDVFCNTQEGEVPKSLEYTVKYFRWEKTITQSELRESVNKRLKMDLGDIKALNVISRGVSGRIVQLEVQGTKGNAVIKGELNIRRALSESTLWSACFYVSETRGWRDVPDSFTLKGAGFGHGVGMCQTGAAMMALRGRKYAQILRHYYQGVTIKRFY